MLFFSEHLAAQSRNDIEVIEVKLCIYLADTLYIQLSLKWFIDYFISHYLFILQILTIRLQYFNLTFHLILK